MSHLIMAPRAGSFTFPAELPAVANTNIWQGANNAEWDVASNWSSHATPVSTDDVVDNLSSTAYIGDQATQDTSASYFDISALTNSGGGQILNGYSGGLNISGDVNNTGSMIKDDGSNDLIGGVSLDSSYIKSDGNLNNNNGTIESTVGADISMAGEFTAVVNQNNGILEAYGQNSYYQPALIALGDENVYGSYLSSITNETGGTIEAIDGGEVGIVSAETNNGIGSTIEAQGENVDGFSSSFFLGSVIAPYPNPTDNLNNSGLIVAANSGTVQQGDKYLGVTTDFNNTSTGTLEVTDLYSKITLFLTDPLTNLGTIKVLNSGTLTVNQDINQTAGLTKVDSNLILQSNTNNVSTLNNFNLSGGTLNGQNGTITGNVIQTGGTFNPGEDPADFSISGNYDLTGGSLQIDIASSSSYDTLLVSGNSNITGGTLSLDFLNGFVPQSGESFDFLQSQGGIKGNFSAFTSNLTGGSYSFNNGILTIDGAPPVPESGTLPTVLLLLTPAGLYASRRKDKSAE